MAKLFTPLAVRSVTLQNRVVFPPLSQYEAVGDHCVGPWHFQHYGSLAASGIGLIVIEDTTVSREGLISEECLGLWNDAQEQALKEMLQRLRTFSQSRFGIQLGHAGRRASAAVGSHGKRSLRKSEGGWTPLAPSAVPYSPSWEAPKSMDSADLEHVKAAFACSALRANRAGFDCLELHYAHGFLVHEFLSPLTNLRTDDYGGALQGRGKFPLEVIEAVREQWPREKPLGLRVSATEWVEGGFELDEVVEFLKWAKQAGVDFVCVSASGNIESAKVPLAPGYLLPFSQSVHSRTDLVVRAVGEIVTPEQAEDALQKSQADLIAIGRAQVNDPRWLWHAAKQLGVSLSHAPQYRSVQPNVWRMTNVANPLRKR